MKITIPAVICIVLTTLIFPVTSDAEQKTVMLATSEFPPFIGKQLLNGGCYTEILREAFRRSGYSIEIRFMPWKRALKSAEMGKYDGVPGGFFSKERSRIFNFSEQVFLMEHVLTRLKNRDIDYTSVNDLKPYTVGMIRGGTFTKFFDEAMLKREEGNNHEQNIAKLLHGRIDLILAPKSVIKSIIRNKFPDHIDDIKTLYPPLSTQGVYMMISRKHPHHETVIADFNKGLNAIKDDGTYEKILQKHGLF